MLVKNWMSKDVVSVGPDDSMHHALGLIKKHNIRMLPVVSDGKLVGVVSDSDFKKASGSDVAVLDVHEMLYLISRIKIKDIMNKQPITVPPDYTVEETAELLMVNKISGVPVVDAKGEVVGVITRDDLFKVLISLSGLGRKGIQFAFLLDDRPGSIKEVSDVVRDFGGRIASILTSYEGAAAGKRIVYLRAYDINRGTLAQLKEALGAKSRLLHVIDHRECEREILCELNG